MPFKFQWIQLNGPGATDPSSLIFVYGISCIQSSTLAVMCWSFILSHCLLFLREVKNPLRKTAHCGLIPCFGFAYGAVCEKHRFLYWFSCGLQYTVSTVWKYQHNKPNVCLLPLRLSYLLEVRVKSHITAAWLSSKHSPFAQLVNKTFPFI